MAAFKDKKNGSWYVQFRYTDWRGERQQKLKRGFATKKEAQAWEREFLMQKQADVNMSFESFVALYEKDVKPKLKLNTWLSKEHIIRTKILPYFKKRKLSEITARDVIDWQNEIRQHTKSSGESYSPDYLKNVHTQLSCIFNHAIKYYGLQIAMPISYDKLWKLLIDKKMNRTDLKDASGISFNVLAKMGKNEFVSMESLLKICIALDCNIGDIVDVMPDKD